MQCALQLVLETGAVLDEYRLLDEYVHLQHNAGLHLLGDLLAVLAVSSGHLSGCSSWLSTFSFWLRGRICDSAAAGIIDLQTHGCDSAAAGMASCAQVLRPAIC